MYNGSGELAAREGNTLSLVRISSTVLIICLWILGFAQAARAQAWDNDPPLPGGDPQWEKVRILYANHYGGKNLAELIAVLTPLKDKYPNTVEPYLWLSRVHYLQARYEKKGSAENFEKAEKFAAQACQMAPKNPLAIRMLADALIYNRDHAYIFGHYGALFKSFSPLPCEEALPPMKNYAGWDAFMQQWAARADITKAQSAVSLMEKIAQEHPNDALAQTWAARAAYCVGEYYTSTGEHDAKGLPYYNKGMLYAGKARKLQPNYVPASYWYQICRARSVQFTSLLNQGRYLMDMLIPLLYADRESGTYYYFGPILTLGTMITNGGWVTEKGMKLANITLEMDMNALEIAEILCPDYFYIPYTRADILAYKGKKKEALAILEKLIARDPDANKQIPENHAFLRLAKDRYNDIKNGKG